MIGIATVGIREISQSKGCRASLDKTFSRLLTINTITTSIVLAVLVASIYLVPKLYENRELMWIGALKLVSTYLLIDWLYKGLEEFKYITNRTILVKCLYVISVFLFIRSAEDTRLYFFMLTMMITANAAINLFHSRKYVTFRFCFDGLKPVFKAVTILGIYGILTSLYTTFNTVFLGFACGDVEVGYYATSHKIFKIILALFTAVTGVMMPRLSSLTAEGRHEEFKSLLKKSFSMLMMIFIPIAAGICVFAPLIIRIIAGPEFEGAIIPLRIIAPLIVIIGIEQIIIIQGLMPLKQDKAILINSIAGAITGITLNILLVPQHGAVGASIAWFASECVVLTSALIFFRKAMKEIK
jgi:O-antigen/teichoic acid export membrane protein